MKLILPKGPGTTDRIIHVFIQDTQSVVGAGKTGLAYNTSGLKAYYIKPGDSAATVITLANITTLGSYVSGGFKEVSSTNMPGVYEFHIPSAVLPSTANRAVIMIFGATGMVPVCIEMQLGIPAAENVGMGAIQYTYTVLNPATGNPLSGAHVWATTDSGGTNLIAAGVTDSFGQVKFWLNAGTYYYWVRKEGYSFTLPDTEVVS